MPSNALYILYQVYSVLGEEMSWREYKIFMKLFEMQSG